MRAVLSQNGGLYCLAFAEHLSYEKGEKLFQFLQKLMKESMIFLFNFNF